MIYAVIDTNVLVSAILTTNPSSPTVKVMNAIIEGRIVPMFNKEILYEYSDVLHRRKFNFSDEQIDAFLNAIIDEGLSAERIKSYKEFPDPKDVVFYEVALSKEDAYLVTGNTKHFPKVPIVVTPNEMIEILERHE